MIKKFITIFSIFLFLSFAMNSSNAIAQSSPKTLTQGLYILKDTGLVTGSAYNVKNSSSTDKSVVIIFDGNQQMQEFIRLEPNSPAYIIKPLNFDSIIVIIGGGSVKFS